MSLDELIKIAYKKFKANLYFDKTQLPLRDRIVSYEQEGIQVHLDEIRDMLLDEKAWPGYKKKILDQIQVLVYPKKLKSISNEITIFNASNAPLEMENPQYFIDLPVEGHILSVLWILSIGIKLDRNNDGQGGMYGHSYGNRLKKNLIPEEHGEVTYSPHLFEPYFTQYESWRDHGLEKAREDLQDKRDAIILTMDFKSFYYSVHLEKQNFKEFLCLVEGQEPWHARVNDFVFLVIKRYSNKLRKVIAKNAELNIKDRNVLPIGFLPSNILSNWVLTPFDDAIIKKWNPVYYGRYVDDIIIVDKVEKNDPIYKRAHQRSAEEPLNANWIINLKLEKNGILQFLPNKATSDESSEKTESDKKFYRINNKILASKKNNILVQGEKVKLFYFQSGATTALLECFKTKIAQNASEFRLLPDMDAMLLHHNYSEIFNLRNQESINKFRGIAGIELDKFALSKFLGKYQKVSKMIVGHEETEFEKDLMLILDERTLIANHTFWERLFEILIINHRFTLYKELAFKIVDALKLYEVPDTICSTDARTHDALLCVLLSALHRSSAIIWNSAFKKELGEICSKVHTLNEDARFSKDILDQFEITAMNRARRAYCTTRMVNKYLLPLPIDCLLPTIEAEDPADVDLSSLDDVLPLMDTSWLNTEDEDAYIYYPYMLTPQELSFVLTCQDLLEGKASFDPATQQEHIDTYYNEKNFPGSTRGTGSRFHTVAVKSDRINKAGGNGRCLYYTEVAGDLPPLDKLNIAVGSVQLSETDFERVLDRRPNRSYDRYKQFAQVFDAAVREKAHMLVLPENFLPFEWIPVVARLCANNKIALVSGVEHIVLPAPETKWNGYVYNLTVTILPYESEGYLFASVSWHNKTVYSPAEKEQINGRRYSFREGNAYQLFGWHNVWFPVYCCFELASIQDRSLFQSYADMVVAVEWNKDVPYYSNIIESLTRDLHCYCVQVNSSDYGDSRIVAPKGSAEKDILKTKGGRNACVLVDTVNIKELRDFQTLEFPLQKQAGRFKPSPPGLDPDGVIEKKRKNQLF